MTEVKITVYRHVPPGMAPDKYVAETKAELADLIARAKAEYESMTQAEREAMARKQAESWVRGEMGIGLDRGEAEYRNKMRESPRMIDPTLPAIDWQARAEAAEAALRLVFPNLLILANVETRENMMLHLVSCIRAAEAVIGRQDKPDWLQRDVDTQEDSA